MMLRFLTIGPLRVPPTWVDGEIVASHPAED